MAVSRVARLHIVRPHPYRRYILDGSACRLCGLGQQDRDGGCVLGQHGQIGNTVAIEVCQNYLEGAKPILAYGRSGCSDGKCAVPCTCQKNDPIVVVVDACKVNLAVVVEVPHRKAIELAGNRDRAGRSFLECSITCAQSDFNAIQVGKCQVENAVSIEISDGYGSWEVVQSERRRQGSKCPIPFAEEDDRAGTVFEVFCYNNIRDAVAVEVSRCNLSKIRGRCKVWSCGVEGSVALAKHDGHSTGGYVVAHNGNIHLAIAVKVGGNHRSHDSIATHHTLVKHGAGLRGTKCPVPFAQQRCDVADRVTIPTQYSQVRFAVAVEIGANHRWIVLGAGHLNGWTSRKRTVPFPRKNCDRT